MATRKTPTRSRGSRRPAARKPSPKSRKAAPARKPAAKPLAAAPPRGSERRRRQPESLRLRDVSVSLPVDDLARSLRVYTEALGFAVKERWEREGKLRGAMLVAGACELGISQDDWAKGRDRVKGVGLRVYAATSQDLDALAARVRSHGAAAVGPKTESWGARTVSVTDPDGFQVTVYREG